MLKYGVPFFILGVGCLLASCGESPQYEENLVLAGERWLPSDSLHFIMPAQDTNSLHTLVLNVAHTEAYPFQNLYIRLSTQFPSGRRASDVINIDMADIGGQWHGACRKGKCTLHAPLRSEFSFSETGIYNITIEQFTRHAELPGVASVGLSLW